MTPQQLAAMKMALDLATMHHTDDGYATLRAKVRSASKEALAQPEQEPVACIGTNGELMWLNKPRVIYSKPQPLYTTPPQRKPLTDEEIQTVHDNVPDDYTEDSWVHSFARAIEAAHGIKENT